MHDIDVMTYVIHWAGFAGAWLLVAGPLVQAAMELRDEGLDRESVEGVSRQVPAPEPISHWWWLLPPVAYLLTRRRQQAQRDAWMRALTVTQREQMVGFSNKATGWLFVAGGASLIFVKEAWELAELYDLPLGLYIAVVVLLAIVAVGNTVLRLRTSDRIIHAGDDEWAAQQTARRAAGRPERSQRTPTDDPDALS